MDKKRPRYPVAPATRTFDISVSLPIAKLKSYMDKDPCGPQQPSGVAGPISQVLLDILVCPLCKVKVVLRDDGSGLKCEACHRVYPIRNNIPIMMVDQATIES